MFGIFGGKTWGRLYGLTSLLLWAVACINLVDLPVAQAASNTITINATVAPTIIIVVDPRGVIQKIYSNTAAQITPTAYTTADTPIAITASIATQYQQIVSHVNLNKAGLVYAAPRPTSPYELLAFLKTFAASL